MEIGKSVLVNKKRNIKNLEYETTKLAKINYSFLEKNKGIFLLPGYPIKKIEKNIQNNHKIIYVTGG